LLHVASLIRGIFRRYLQYIKLCLDKHMEPESADLIDEDLVQKAITRERVSQDMDGELSQLFPRNPEARSMAIMILNLLEEDGDWNQKSLAEQLEIPEYKLSRLSRRLELGRYISRERTGLNKIITLAEPVRLSGSTG
jgi:hypothetical protein